MIKLTHILNTSKNENDAIGAYFGISFNEWHNQSGSDLIQDNLFGLCVYDSDCQDYFEAVDLIVTWCSRMNEDETVYIWLDK